MASNTIESIEMLHRLLNLTYKVQCKTKISLPKKNDKELEEQRAFYTQIKWLEGTLPDPVKLTLNRQRIRNYVVHSTK